MQEKLEYPAKLWKSISGFATVEECVAVTGREDYYVGDGMWILPNGELENED